MKETLISINNVSFNYNGEKALDEISLDITKGEFLGVIGPNGSGKTTLLKIILGLLKPTSGTVKLFGKEIELFKDWSKIGYVPQRAGLQVINFPITVEEVVGMGRLNNKRVVDFLTKADREAIDQSLIAVGMEKYKKSLLRELSGGQQQKIFIARALTAKPQLLILDEPTVGVDIESQTKFYQLLKELNRNFDLTLVLVSHDIDVVAHEVTNLACINCKLVCHGPPKQIMKSNFMEKLYGESLRLIVHGH